MEFKSQYAPLSDVTLHYVSAGQGPLLLFLHGFPEFWYMWRNQIRDFSDNYQVVAVDLRGYNLSSKPEAVGGYRRERLVEDIREFIEYLGHHQAILIGHDWGGGVAWAFALTNPEWLSRLIIINAPHPAIFARELKQNPEQQAASVYIPMLQSAKAEATLGAENFYWLKRALWGQDVPNETELAAYTQAWSQPGALTAMANYYRALAPVTNAEKTITTPTLVIWGEQDKALVLNNLTGLEQYVTQLQVQRVPDASHWVVREKPREVTKWIQQFCLTTPLAKNKNVT